VAAVFEWVVAVIFTAYVLTFLVDLLPAVKGEQEWVNRVGDGQGGMGVEMGIANGGRGGGDGVVGALKPPDSAQNF